jgi:hypothetical protein
MLYKVVKMIKTHILFSITFVFENRAVYEIMKNMVEPEAKNDITIWRICVACWISSAARAWTRPRARAAKSFYSFNPTAAKIT